MLEAKGGLQTQFMEELIGWTETGKLPQSANQDVRYSLEVQYERLKRKNVQMKMIMEDTGVSSDGLVEGSKSMPDSRNSVKYESRVQFRNFNRRLEFYQNGNKKFTHKDKVISYVTTTWLKQGRVDENESYCCPNCGAVSTIKELQEGCPYCQTKFTMSDLFPKVTDFLYAKDCIEDKKPLLRKTFFCTVTGAVLLGAWVFFHMEEDVDLLSKLFSTVASSLLGAFLGYSAFAIFKIIGLLGSAAGSMKPIAEQKMTRNTLTPVLAGFDPSFNFHFFLNQLISTMKIILFAKERLQMPQYIGTESHPEFDDIVESEFNGRFKLNNYQVRDGHCMISLDIGMNDIYEQQGKFFMKQDTFCVNIVKNVCFPEELGFSIKKVQCKSCSGSFDATKQKVCPYCGAPYVMMDDAWVVTEMMRR